MMSLLVKLYKYTFVNNENLITSYINLIFLKYISNIDKVYVDNV